MRPLFGALLLVCSTTIATPVLADDARAAEAFQRGTEAYGRNEFANAAKFFERAFLESPRGAAAYNAGLAWEAAGDGPRAADQYASALSRGDLSAAQTTDADKRLKALQKTLGRVDVTGPAGSTVTVGHADRVPLPATVNLHPGQYPVRVAFSDGTTTIKQVTISSGASSSVIVERAAALAPPPPSLAPPPPPPATTSPPPSPPDADSPKSSTPTMRYVGFGAIGLGIVAAGVGAYTGVKALDARDEFNASNRTNQDAHDRADSLRTTTNVLFIAGGVVAAIGVVLVVTNLGPSDGSAKASLQVTPGGADVRVRF